MKEQEPCLICGEYYPPTGRIICDECDKYTTEPVELNRRGEFEV